MSEPNVPAARSWPAIVALAINLVPVIGVVFWGWSAFALIFLYWIENLVVGVRTLANMVANAAMSGAKGRGLLFHGPFFTVHYGMFCLVHGTFVVALFGPSDAPFDVLNAARHLLAKEPDLLAGLASIVLWQLVQFARFVASREVRTVDARGLMFAPYPRIVILHLTIMLGGFLLQLLSEPVAGLVILALLKTAFDVAEAMGRGPDFVGQLRRRAAETLR